MLSGASSFLVRPLHVPGQLLVWASVCSRKHVQSSDCRRVNSERVCPPAGRSSRPCAAAAEAGGEGEACSGEGRCQWEQQAESRSLKESNTPHVSSPECRAALLIQLRGLAAGTSSRVHRPRAPVPEFQKRNQSSWTLEGEAS